MLHFVPVDQRAPARLQFRALVKSAWIFHRLSGMTEFVSMSEGKGFGELALKNNRPRATTALCTNNCFFAVVNKAAYKEVIEKI